MSNGAGQEHGSLPPVEDSERQRATWELDERISFELASYALYSKFVSNWNRSRGDVYHPSVLVKSNYYFRLGTELRSRIREARADARRLRPNDPRIVELSQSLEDLDVMLAATPDDLTAAMLETRDGPRLTVEDLRRELRAVPK
jgi:hypothetical protein